jgi:hypothetical protein
MLAIVQCSQRRPKIKLTPCDKIAALRPTKEYWIVISNHASLLRQSNKYDMFSNLFHCGMASVKEGNKLPSKNWTAMSKERNNTHKQCIKQI